MLSELMILASQALAPDRDTLFGEAERIANDIKLCVPSVVQAIKHIVRRVYNSQADQSQKLAKPIMKQIQDNKARVEGAKAFTKQRIPKRSR